MRQLTDALAAGLGEAGGMRIRISVDEPDPPVGAAAAEGGEPRAFEGWLGLIAVLSELFGGAAAPRMTHSPIDSISQRETDAASERSER
jgi:hypothetical protein